MPAVVPFIPAILTAGKVAASVAAVKGAADAFKKPKAQSPMSVEQPKVETPEDMAKKQSELARKASILRQGEMTQTQYGGLGGSQNIVQKRSLLGGV